MFRIILTYGLLLATALSFSTTAVVEAKTAVLFGATGAVGNEVLRSIVRSQFFTKIILVGRTSFPPKVTDLFPQSSSSSSQSQLLPEVVKVQVPDLTDVDKNEELLAMEADSCFIAVASGFPYMSDLHDWHLVEVDMAASMARLCSQMHVRSLTIFSAIDSVESPDPFTEDELVKKDDGDDATTPMGWWIMIKNIYRMMGLKENAVTSNSKTIPFVRIFQPANIFTKEIRYGWLDWTLFKIQPLFDPWIPTRYHSVNVTLLGMAMVGDAVRILSETTSSDDDTIRDEEGATRLTYGDFLRIAEKDYKKFEQEQTIIGEEKSTEL